MFDFLKPKIKVRSGKKTPTVLVILDGWGIAPPSPGNAITLAKLPNFNKYMNSYPHGQLLASGESVGLPAGEVGNTEVGHLNIGAGRLILQDLKRIDKAITDGAFFENRSLYRMIKHSQDAKSNVHIMGLATSANVHASLNHLFALLDFCKRTNTKNVYLHLFTDGRDADPQDGINVIQKIDDYIKANGIGQIATITGRYYAMDRDLRWERTQKAYEAIVKGAGEKATSAAECLQASYANKITDEFVVPTVINPNGMIKDNDSVVFFNFRIDRPRQLAMSFVIEDFAKAGISWEFDPYAVKYGQKHAEGKEVILKTEPFPRGKPLTNLYFATMTQFQKNLPVSDVLFPPEEIKESLSVVLANHNLKQMHMSESEKERFVTYYFDGLREDHQVGEDVLIVPSPKVATYDLKPEMSVKKLCEEFKNVLNKDVYDFIIINIANPDMVAHSGKIKPTIKALEEVDAVLGDMIDSVLVCNGNVVMTADHGNAEELITYPTNAFFYTSKEGSINTEHSTFPVPVIIINKTLAGNPKSLPSGTLADVAPTILSLMKIEIPPIMTGKNLLV